MSLRRLFPLLAGVLLAACSTVSPSPEPAPPPPGVEEEDLCGATRVQRYLGERYRESLDAALLRESGAGALRVLRPGMVQTLEYRADRLDVSLDGDDTITAIRCG